MSHRRWPRFGYALKETRGDGWLPAHDRDHAENMKDVLEDRTLQPYEVWAGHYIEGGNFQPDKKVS